MSLIVYNKELNNYHEITHAISVQMTAHYNDIGKVILTLPIDEYNISIIENDGVIYDTTRDLSYIIKNYKYDTVRNIITVNGFTCNWILNKRAIATKKTIANVESDLYDLISENLRGLSVETSELIGLTDETDVVLYGGQILDSIMPVLDESEMGNEMLWDVDRNAHVFKIYKGKDLTSGLNAAVFSEEFGSAKKLIISEDDSVFKNFAYVVGELQSGKTIVVEVGTATGDDRNELWVERSFRQEPDESETAFKKRLKQIGVEELGKSIKRQTFSVTIDTADYGTKYNLGDVVSCVSVRFGVELNSRIKGVKYTLDANGENLNLILGEPILTALKEVKTRG